MPNDNPVFNPIRCQVPFVAPIPDIPGIEDCFIPEVPGPIFDGPPTQVPIIGTPGPIGPAGPAGADGINGTDGTDGSDGLDGDARCPQMSASVFATCNGEATFASVTVIELEDTPGEVCNTHMSFQFSLCQGPQGPQGPPGECPQCQAGPQGPQGPPGVCQCEIQGCWATVLTDWRVEGEEIQVKTQRIRVLECDDETDWITAHTGTNCQA